MGLGSRRRSGVTLIVCCLTVGAFNCGPLEAQRARDLTQVIGDLESRDPGVQIEASMELVRFGSEASRALPALRRAYKTLNQDAAIVRAFAVIGRPALRDLIDVADTNNNPGVLNLGIVEDALVLMGRDVVPDLLAASVGVMRDPNRSVVDRRVGLRPVLDRVYERFGIVALPPLVTALRSNDPLVRGEAACWIAMLDTEARGALPVLEDALMRTPDEPAHDWIEYAIARVRPPGRRRSADGGC